MALQFMTDTEVSQSWGIPCNFEDEIDVIHEKVCANAWLHLSLNNNDVSNSILELYKGDLLRLKRRLLLTLIRGTNRGEHYVMFELLAHKLLQSGLDFNFTETTYEGQTTIPHQYAVDLKYNRIAQYLLEHGVKDTQQYHD